MDEDLKAAIHLVEEWNARGWGEYLLYEILEGKREHPFPAWVGITVSDLMLGALCRLQTEHKVWFAWMKGRWRTVPIEKWITFAAALTADEAREISVKL
jgi:hypothetical protein